MNLIQITDELAIQSSNKDWSVAKKGTAKDKATGLMVDTWTPFTFHSTLDRAVKSLGEHMLRTGNAKSCDELIQAAADISEILSKKFTANAEIRIR